MSISLYKNEEYFSRIFLFEYFFYNALKKKI